MVPLCPCVDEVVRLHRQAGSKLPGSFVLCMAASQGTRVRVKTRTDRKVGSVGRDDLVGFLCFARCGCKNYTSEAGPFAN